MNGGKTFSEKVIQFNKQLNFKGRLPGGIQMMNPFKDNPEILPATEIFYEKFYNDNGKRKLILGINPGRLGAGATGIAFTDTKRLKTICGIEINSFSTHEPSSVFIYDVIEKYGGAKKFYSDFYISSVCPLGFIKKNRKGNWINLNYYDSPGLFKTIRNFITSNLKKLINFGIDTDTCFILGKKNEKFFRVINEKEKLFKSIDVLEHPRYIVQYRFKEKEKYVSEYLRKLRYSYAGCRQ